MLISGLFEIVCAFLCCDAFEDIAERCADCVETAGCGLAQPMFEFSENLLDRVQVGRIFRQEKQPSVRCEV